MFIANIREMLKGVCISLCIVQAGAVFVSAADDNEWIPPVIKDGIPITGFGVFNGDPCYYACKTVSTIYRFDFGPESPSRPYLLATDGYWPTIDRQGGRIAYAAVSEDEETYRICIMDSDGKNPRYIPDVALSSFSSMSWTEDDRIIVYGTPSAGDHMDQIGFYLYDLDGQEYYLGTSERGDDLVVRGEVIAWTGPGLATWDPQSPEGSLTDFDGVEYFDEARNHSPAIPPSKEHVIFNYSILTGFEHYYLDNVQEASDQFKPVKAASDYAYCENYVSPAGARDLDKWLMFIVIKPQRAEEFNTLPQIHVLDKSSKRVYLLTHEFDSIPANPSFWIGDNATTEARPRSAARRMRHKVARPSVVLDHSSALPRQLLIDANARDPRSRLFDIRGRRFRR
jgi:hypothetical protein